MEPIQNPNTPWLDYAYKHEGAEVGIKFHTQSDVDWIYIKIITPDSAYCFKFLDRFNHGGAITTSALVYQDKDDQRTTLLDTGTKGVTSSISSENIYKESDIITRGKNLLKNKINPHPMLSDLFDKYVPGNLEYINQQLNPSKRDFNNFFRSTYQKTNS